MLVDAHFHADGLAAARPGFASDYRALGVLGLASAHTAANLARGRSLMADAGPCLFSLGIHPQLPVLDEAEALAAAAMGGAIAAVGECGFDFYDDDNGMPRTPANEARQREAFELQLELAERAGLPLVIHLRAALDLAFAYARRLARLESVIFHSWPGPANEALALLARCPNALFSFGGSVLNGNKKARASAAALPASALLTETDAPFQPPRTAPRPGARLLRPYSSQADLRLTLAELAALRGCAPVAVEEAVELNFRRTFSHAL